jgi:hypothetical protein
VQTANTVYGVINTYGTIAVAFSQCWSFFSGKLYKLVDSQNENPVVVFLD